jgi:ribosome-associated toxin RatA of RatAB toxin-antitoxin module
MARVQRARVVDVAPDAAFELWTDVRRWPTFVDGFGHVERLDSEWPAVGAKLVWRSVPSGRGLVTEKVTASEPGARFVTAVLEDRLAGTQTVELAPAEEGGTSIALALDYELTKGGPLAALTDAIFIRRAQGDALARTLRRFATEAAEQAAL